MAERRMFSKMIVQSSRFLKMPVSSRELYFQMGMAADDDGVVEAWNVMRLTNAREDDLRVLVSKGYVQILDNEDLIAYLSDWSTNNTIRKDRYHEGIYKSLKLQILDAIEQNDNQVTTKCQPNDNQCETEVRLGKDSIGKNNNINEQNAEELFQKLWKCYPKKKGKGQVSKKTKKQIANIGYDHMMRCIDRYKKDTKNMDEQYIMYGSTFFNSGYIDYLDENYEAPQERKVNPKQNNFNNFEQRSYNYQDLEKQLRRKNLSSNPDDFDPGSYDYSGVIGRFKEKK